MTDKTSAERPNRVVTCQMCGVKMPQRYLARHMQGHAQPAADSLPVSPENAPEQESSPEQPPQLDANSGDERSGNIICPACAGFVAEEEFANHMQAQHTNWCPLCHARAKDLAEHLHSRHLLKPIQPAPLYARSWETQKRFICLGCKKKVSVWSYPKHAAPHGATRGLAPRKGPAAKAPAAPAPDGTEEQAPQKIMCLYCQEEVLKSAILEHLAQEHPACPYCNIRQPRLEMNDHIQSKHPGMRLPE
jgi:hypothetical protein